LSPVQIKCLLNRLDLYSAIIAGLLLCAQEEWRMHQFKEALSHLVHVFQQSIIFNELILVYLAFDAAWAQSFPHVYVPKIRFNQLIIVYIAFDAAAAAGTASARTSGEQW
jgi:hypothetical protein